MTQGQFTSLDWESLGKAGVGLKDIQEYLAPFVRQEDAGLPDYIPPLDIGTILRLKGMGHNGGDGYISDLHNPFSIVDYGTEWPSFARQFAVPVLVDPKMYSTEEFAVLSAEGADGYAQQVVYTWSSIQESEKYHPSFMRQPIVVRALAVLPVPPAEAKGGSDFAVDFLPQISKTQPDIEGNIKRAYDVRLLVKGGENAGANYIEFATLFNQRPVFADSQGKRAPLTVMRGRHVAEGSPASIDDLGLTPRSQRAIALYITPQLVENKPAQAPLQVPMNSGRRTLSRETEKGVGAAYVDVGPSSSWMNSARRTERPWDRIVPVVLLLCQCNC